MFDLYSPLLRNKAVLNSSPDLPLLFLFAQLVIAVILLHVSALFTSKVEIPRLDIHAAKKLAPVVTVNIVGLVFNTLCLRDVEASFFQVNILPCCLESFLIVVPKSDCAWFGSPAHHRCLDSRYPRTALQSHYFCCCHRHRRLLCRGRTTKWPSGDVHPVHAFIILWRTLLAFHRHSCRSHQGIPALL